MIPESIQKFIDSFSKLPSLGPRLVTRLAFFLLNLDRATLNNLVSALNGLKELDRCGQCFFLKNGNEKLCDICSDQKRDHDIIAIIEKETDLISIEKTGRFKGNYLILGELNERGVLESIQKLRLKQLKDRINKEMGGKIKEIIIALNPNTFGDFVADLIRQEFKNLAEKITRLGRGIPTGGEIEFADEETLNSALERRN
ncbi:MAG: toprim domain-containing protein [Patescibacteria group bacterium]|nr:toprim domain-containing protein [Patescibacteria group bacterium]